VRKRRKDKEFLRLKGKLKRKSVGRKRELDFLRSNRQWMTEII